MGPCAFCRQAAAAPRSCPRCRALYHADCWDANDRRCAIYGCEPARPPAVLPVHRVEPLAAPRLNWGWVVFGLIVASNLGRLLSSVPGERYRPSNPVLFAELQPREEPAEQVRFLLRQADALVPPPTVPPVVGERRRRDLELAIALLEQARRILPPQPGADLRRFEIGLRVAELKRMRDGPP